MAVQSVVLMVAETENLLVEQWADWLVIYLVVLMASDLADSLVVLMAA